MINDPKDLEKILKLCRKYGLKEITLSGFRATFGDLPTDEQPAEEAAAAFMDDIDRQIAAHLDVDELRPT